MKFLFNHDHLHFLIKEIEDKTNDALLYAKSFKRSMYPSGLIKLKLQNDVFD